MNTILNPKKTGLALGGLFGLVHLVWAVLLVLGFAQPLMNFIFTLHMVQPAFTVVTFSLGMALGLVIVTAIVGFVVGWVFASIWNTVSEK